MTRKIAYIGFGAMGAQLSEMIRHDSKEELEEVYFDDPGFNNQRLNTKPFSFYTDPEFENYEFFICLGYKHLSLRANILLELKKLNRKLGSFIHPTCIISPTAKIEAGCILYPGCNIDQRVTVLSGTLLNNGVIVSHDCIVGENCFLAPGVIVCGNVNIEETTFIGAGSVISNNINIGQNVIIGPGTVVTFPVLNDQSAIGNPLRILEKRLTLL